MNLLQLIKLLFGPRALSKTLGTRTNVIRLPDNKLKRYIKEDLNIEAASDDLAKKAYKDMQELVAEVPKMNDAERLIFEGNLRRLKNKLKIKDPSDPTAEVIEFGTKQKVSPKGIQTLVKEKGQVNPPGTLMGNLESRIKQLEARGEDLSKRKGQTLDDILGDVASSQKGMRQLEREGLVRATARDIITSDIKSGKLKLPKELEQQILEGGGEPIDILRNVYGEDALEVLDSLTPEFSKLRTSAEAEKLARSKFTFEPNVNRPKGSMSLEEAAKAEQENILTPKKPEEPEDFATGGRVGYANGSMSKGLDYLSGIERRGYADGTDYMDFINRLADINAGVYSPSGGLLPGYTYDPATGTFTNPMGLRMGPDAYRQDVLYYTPAPTQDLDNGLPSKVPEGNYRIGSDGQYYTTTDGIERTVGNYTLGPDGNYYDAGSGQIIQAGENTSTPTEDFSDYLNGLTPNWSPGDPAPEGYEVVSGNGDTWIEPKDTMVSPEDALTPELPNVNPFQQHFDQNQMLKNAVAAGTITPEEYNILGGYDVQQTMAAGNPVLGGIGNLIGSVPYNIYQSIKGDQPFSDIPGDVMRNVQGGMGMISPELKQTYQDIVNQRLPYMQQYQQNYQQQIAQVDPNALHTRYKQNLENPNMQSNYEQVLRTNLLGPAGTALSYLVGE